MRLVYLTLFSLLPVSQGWAAACCGGGFAAPALILGDDQAQFTASFAHSQTKADVGADRWWRKRAGAQVSQTLRFDGAHIFWDRWQVGGSLAVVEKKRGSERAVGLGDGSGSLGYEYLTDWDYHPWRPRGVGFLQVIAPTGRSVHEAENRFQLDARGRGLWSIGLGTILTKTIENLDLFATLDVHRSLPRTFPDGTLAAGYGGNAGAGAGYNFGPLRVGTSLTWSYEDPVRWNGARASLQRFTTATASASYMLPGEWAATVTYADQTLFGHPVNVSLSQSGTLFFQKRWLR